MTLKFVSPLDSAFMLVERDEMPWHIANLMMFSKPGGAKPDFVATLREQMRGGPVVAPYNQAPAFSRLRQFPLQRVATEIDFDHHVRLHQLAPGATQEDLLDLVADIHDQGLDGNHPSWELHLIDGVADDRFGVFIKIHHSILDAVAARTAPTTPRPRGRSGGRQQP